MSTTSGRLGKQANEVANDVQRMGGALKNAAHESLGQLRETASEYCEQGLDRLRHAKHHAGQFIQGLPIKSVLIAAVVGFLLGLSWPRR
jgi:ElaB/YqjD/DUF883 family membrane-anchored ribosome-binding protein